MTKKKIIQKIQAIIKEHGDFTTADVMADSSPCVGTLGGTTQLLEEFYKDKAKAICYDRQDEEVSEDFIAYDKLKANLLEEILCLAERFKEQETEE